MSFWEQKKPKITFLENSASVWRLANNLMDRAYLKLNFFRFFSLLQNSKFCVIFTAQIYIFYDYQIEILTLKIYFIFY